MSTVDAYRVDGAETVIVTLGSVSGTIKDVADEFGNVGVLTLTMFRPFPYAEVRKALGAAKRVVVVERAFAPGAGGIVSADVRTALAGTFAEVSTVVAGLGGRAVTKPALRRLVADAMSGWLGERLVFLDLRDELIEQQIERMRQRRASGPPRPGGAA